MDTMKNAFELCRNTCESAMESLKKLIMNKPVVKECLAEILGTFVLILVGCGASAQTILSNKEEGNSLTVALGFSVGLMVAVWVSGGISGGHLNPAVSLTMACLGKLKWRKVVFYSIAQMIGAFLGAAAVYGIYYNKIHAFNNGKLTPFGVGGTGKIFASYAEGLTIPEGLFDQVLGTALLVLGILAVTDQRNIGTPTSSQPLGIGLTLLAISLSLGLNCGYPVNPARDLGPRIFTAMAGWGSAVFTSGKHWWWIPVVGPMIGGPIGALIYYMFIALYHGVDEEEKQEQDDGRKGLAEQNENLALVVVELYSEPGPLQEVAFLAEQNENLAQAVVESSSEPGPLQEVAFLAEQNENLPLVVVESSSEPGPLQEVAFLAEQNENLPLVVVESSSEPGPLQEVEGSGP